MLWMFLCMSSSVWLCGCSSEILLSEKDYCIYAASVGVTEELDRPSGSGSSEDSGCSSRKRPRKEGLGGGGFFDLNLPAEFVDRNWLWRTPYYTYRRTGLTT